MIISKNLNKNSPIAFFDSGVGGLTVLNKVKAILPNENFVYYGDTLHMPYGEKTKEELLEFSSKIFEFFESLECKAVVMACNTTSSVIYNEVADKYGFKLYPIVQSVSSILSNLPVNKLGIFATRATIESKAYEREISKYNSDIQVFGKYCPHWVHIVEENSATTEESISIIKADLDSMLECSPDKIVLGCTHYPFLLDVLSSFASKELFIDPAIAFAQYIKTDLTLSGLLNDSDDVKTERFYVSSNPEQFKASAKMFYELNSLPELLTFCDKV